MGKKLRIAIIGTGIRGTGCFTALLKEREDAEIAAYCDNNRKRAEKAAEIYQIHPAIYTSVEEMAAREKLDGVIITVPDCFHHEYAVKALNSGWNVLIDKPLATNVKDCQDIIRTAEKTGKTVMIGFNLRHHPVLKRLKEIIDEGVLGKVFLCENREFYDGGRTYMSRWNRLFQYTGGLWIHKGSHDFDIFNWLLDFPKPLRVTSFAAVNVLNPDGLPFPQEAGHKPGPDCSVCYYKDRCKDKYELSREELQLWGPEEVAEDGYVKNLCMYLSDKDNHDNGIAMVEYEGGLKASHFECFIGSKSDRIYTIAGDRGIAEVSLTDRTIKVTPRWRRDGESVTYRVGGEMEGGHGGADPSLVDTFCRVLRGEAIPNSTAEHGLLSTSIGQAAEISRREHRMVEISELYR